MPASLASAIAWQESGFNNAMVSSANARGVMQVLPGTWQWVQHNLALRQLNPANPIDNVGAGVLYLGRLLQQTGGDPAMAAAGYYQGLASVRRIGMLPETQRYVANVLALRIAVRGLKPTKHPSLGPRAPNSGTFLECTPMRGKFPERSARGAPNRQRRGSASPRCHGPRRDPEPTPGRSYDAEAFAASCPHAASMSRPRVSRTVAWTPCSSRTALNAAIFSGGEPSYIPVGLYGIRLTLNVRPAPSSEASARACAARR